MKDILVIYHKIDSDGFGASWVAWLKFKDRAEYLGFDYLNGFPLEVKNKTIYLLDVSLDSKKIETLKENNNKIILIDHHLSSLKNKDLVDEFVVEIKHSAAVLAFKYFFKKKKMPKILKYIEDQDIWRFKLPHSREINLVIDLFENDYKKWNRYAKEIENPKKFKEFVKEGKKLIKYQDYLLKRILSQAVLVEFEGYKVLAVNSPILISEAGNLLCKKRPPIAIVWSFNSTKKKISLRSDGSIDVSKIAEKYGGGGHKGAASFALPIDTDLPWKIINS